MRKYFTIIVITLMAMHTLQGQVYVQSTIPTVGLVQKNQLWNLVIINGTAAPMEGKLNLVLRDRQSGIDLMTATTSRFSLPKGSLPVNSNNLNPVQYNYLGLDPGKMMNGLLPVGAYLACYSFIKMEGQKQEPMAEECVAFDTEPLSPPMLTMPFDKSVLQTIYPQFSWIPPAPLTMLGNLNYEIIVTEILTGQTPAEAIQYNTPSYTNHNLRSPFEAYPSTFSRLKEEQFYAWQVTARDGFNYAAKTETWSFVIKLQDTAKVITSEEPYMMLGRSNEPSGIGIVSNNILRIKYYSFEKEHEGTLKLMSAGGKLMMEVKQKILYGDNFMEFKLTNQFVPGQVYVVSVSDSQKNIYSSRFSIKQTN